MDDLLLISTHPLLVLVISLFLNVVKIRILVIKV